MKATHRRLRRTVLATALSLALVGGSLPALATPAPERIGPPSAIASTGDSITRGFHTQSLLTDSVQNSWSTGTNTAVNSVYNRILELNPAIAGNNHNNALTGARMNDFARQAGNAASNDPELVTVLLGANDACTSTEASMTPVATYEQQFRAGMEILATEAPETLVFVSSVPNIYRLWEIGRNNFTARLQWSLYGICQSMLANAGSTSAGDEARRQRVLQRVRDYNATLEAVCAEYLRCRSDGGAAFALQFTASDMSTLDFFHPNNNGQAKAASAAWGAMFDFADLTPPTTTLVADRDPDGLGWYAADVDVQLRSDDEDLRGTEFQYQLRGAERTSWVTYGGPFTIDTEGETDIAFRSIDVNGNVEAEQGAEILLDRTDPEVTVTCTEAPVVIGGVAEATVTATDELAGFDEDPNGVFRLDTSEVGIHTHQIEVQDRAGNKASDTCQFTVVYGGAEVTEPLRIDGSSTFRAGSTVPIKFTLTDAVGERLDDVAATLSYTKLGDATSATVEALPPAQAHTGNQFRYDAGAGQYVFNWGTRGLAAGLYELSIDLGEGSPRTVLVSLR
jgi:lysophospholipase L1-like esterase